MCVRACACVCVRVCVTVIVYLPVSPPGLQDPMIVVPLLKGQLTHVPDSGDNFVEFIYVENAAAFHVDALEALLKEQEWKGSLDDTMRLAGNVFNGTNGDTPKIYPEMSKAELRKVYQLARNGREYVNVVPRYWGPHGAST